MLSQELNLLRARVFSGGCSSEVGGDLVFYFCPHRADRWTVTVPLSQRIQMSGYPHPPS